MPETPTPTGYHRKTLTLVLALIQQITGMILLDLRVGYLSLSLFRA